MDCSDMQLAVSRERRGYDKSEPDMIPTTRTEVETYDFENAPIHIRGNAVVRGPLSWQNFLMEAFGRTCDGRSQNACSFGRHVGCMKRLSSFPTIAPIDTKDMLGVWSLSKSCSWSRFLCRTHQG